ncbi:uracil-DNA glycosylase [Alcaligenaceae bacterium]|nr:uracil-DNA glycosylase [Alcaligenaceae bacterium]
MSGPSASCPLCAESGGSLVWQNDVLRVVIVNDAGLPGYTRVIWHAHVPEMTDLDARQRGHLMRIVFLVEGVQRQVLLADKVNLASLGNMTPHLHWHVIPRWRDDPWFPDSIWAPHRARDEKDAAQWGERGGILNALQGEYAAALRTRLEHSAVSDSTDSPHPAGRENRRAPGSSGQNPAPPHRSETGERGGDQRGGAVPPAQGSDNRLRELPGRQLAALHPEWRAALDTPEVTAALRRLDQFLAERLEKGAVIYPARVFRALELLAPADVRVVILGQDPYHGPGQAQGLAFSVPDRCPAPPSLRNMFNELAREYPDRRMRRHNDLSDWSRQGVLLLNTSLSVEQGAAGSHARKGWEIVTDALIQAMAASPRPKVFMLWGSHAQGKQPLLTAAGQEHKIMRANHPSPLSALRPPRPFIGCGHFSQANDWLAARGQEPVDWVGTDAA